MPAVKGTTGTIVVEQLCVGYDGSPNWALEDVTVDIAPSQFVFVAGPSGAGKTSFLRALCGYVPLITGNSRGKVALAGTMINELSLSEISALVRFVGEDSADAIVGLTVGQELLSLASSEKEARVSAECMGLGHLWNLSTESLSGGQRARLVLAGVLVARPPVLLLDNPLQELDQAGRRDFIEALLRLRSNYTVTVVATDPFIHEFLPYIERVLVIREAKMSLDLSAPLGLGDVAHLIGPALPSYAKSTAGFPATGEHIAEMKNVSVRIDGAPVLKGIDLSISENDFIALTGPNGSGKTTAMLTLAGVIRPSSGSIWIREGTRIGFVFQEAALQLVAKTVGDELRISAILDGLSIESAQAFASRQLGWLTLEDTDSTIDLHSSQARILACSTIPDDVKLVIFDEPTLGLAAADARKTIDYITSLWLKGMTVITISHDPRLIKAARRIIGLDNGRVVGNGPYTLTKIAEHRLDTSFGTFNLELFEYGSEDGPVAVLSQRHASGIPLLRVQFGCLYSTALQSTDCDCRLQIRQALESLSADSVGGMLVYLPGADGRGHGLSEKAKIVAKERQSNQGGVFASVEAGVRYANYESLDSLPFVLDALNITGPVRLITNSPLKYAALVSVGVAVSSVVNLQINEEALSSFARQELLEKRVVLGHNTSVKGNPFV